MSGWPTATLGEIAQPKQWPTLSMSEMATTGFPVYGANGRIGYTVQFTHERPTILIGCRGSCGTVHITEPQSYANGNAMALDALDESRVDIHFLAHFLAQRGFRDVTTGTSQPQIIRQNLVRVLVPLPPLPEQRRIADILGKADALRAKRRAALAQLDSLTQSIFLDMFGDPATNSKGWPEGMSLGDVAEIVSGITKGRKLNGKPTRSVPYLAVINVQERALNLSTVKTIEATDEEIKRYSLQSGDLLLTEGGDPDKLGRGTLWGNQLPNCIHQNHVFRVRLTTDAVEPLFLEWLVGSQRGKQYFLRSAKQTTGIASINMTQLRGFPLLLPPVELQREFAARLGATEIIEAAQRKAIAKLDAMFGSLQHRAFRGEL